jgi:hypothetical protein
MIVKKEEVIINNNYAKYNFNLFIIMESILKGEK